MPILINDRSCFSNVIYNIRVKFIRGVLSQLTLMCFSNANSNRPIYSNSLTDNIDTKHLLFCLLKEIVFGGKNLLTCFFF